jgi:tetratricopeptide (TPR) repeat protein
VKYAARIGARIVADVRDKLKLMAAEDKKDIQQEAVDKAQAAGEMSARDAASFVDSAGLSAPEELSAHDVFVGDEDFYKLLAESLETSAASSSVASGESTKSVSLRGRFSVVQKALAIGMIGIGLLLVYLLMNYPSSRTSGPASASGSEAAARIPEPPSLEPSVVEPVSEQAKRAVDKVKDAGSLPEPTEPVSLEVARSFFQKEDYDRARGAYNQLGQALPAREELLRDFLKLKMAVCAMEVGDFSDASRLLVEISRSPSPMVNIVANFRLSLIEIRRKRYLRARTRAYRALGLIEAVDFNDDWALALECDCHFLIAECLTRYILSLSHVETDLPGDLWGGQKASLDPFADLDEATLNRALNSGSQRLGKALLEPRIRRLISPPRWAVTSYGAPVEEILSKFAASANLDIEWITDGTPSANTETVGLRQRPVSLYLPAATPDKVALITAGCVGLLARPENDLERERIAIHDPTRYSSLRRHISFLSDQAISLWQKFVLTFHSDQRLGNAHFVMGLLQSQAGRTTEAIAEYKLVANRFSHSHLAPFALFHSSKIKAGLRDYGGAREDLRQLVEQYDDSDVYGRAYLRLADATRDASLTAEAASLYQRVYNFGLSRESQIAAALGAAECYYQTGSYHDAAKWITRYINLAGQDEDTNLYSAHFLLGRTSLALGDYQKACDAFEYALVEQTSREQYIEALMALVKGHIEQDNLVEALDALENVRSVSLSQEQSVEILLLRCKVYRLLGLADTAAILLRDRAQYVTDSQLSAKIGFELAMCGVVKGNLDEARRRLTDVLAIAEPGPLAQKTALKLVGVCLKLGRSSQAISICRQLLNSNVSAGTRQQVLRLLAAGYKLEKDYDNAALALSGNCK